MRLLPSPVGVACRSRIPQPLRSSPITGPSPLLRAAPPLCPASVYTALAGDFPLELLPSHRDDRFPRSATEPDPGSRHRLQAGCRSGRASGLRPNLSRRPLPSLRFRHRPVNFGTSSAVRLRSSLRISPDGIRSRLFCDAHHHRFLRQQLAVVWSLLLIAGSEGASPHLSCSSTPSLRSVCSRHT